MIAEKGSRMMREDWRGGEAGRLEKLRSPRFRVDFGLKGGWISLDFLGLSRQNRAFSMGYGECSRYVFSGPDVGP